MTIKEIRALTGLTQKQFAEKYHITFSSIRNWESGHRTCPDYVAELLEFKVREDLKMFGEFTLRNFLETLTCDIECEIVTNKDTGMAKTILKEENIALDDFVEKWEVKDGKLLVWI